MPTAQFAKSTLLKILIRRDQSQCVRDHCTARHAQMFNDAAARQR